MIFYISVSLDYGAKEFFWKSTFNNIEELTKWWLEDVNLVQFEKTIKEDKNFLPIIHDRDEDNGDLLLIYKLFLNNPFHIKLIDGLDYLSNLVCVDKIIYKNGKTKMIPKDSHAEIDLSISARTDTIKTWKP